MGFTQRLFKTASVIRRENATDNYGGIRPVETEIVASYDFHVFNMTPYDREAMITKFGAEPEAVMMKGTGEYNTSIANLDILQVSDTERWRIMSLSPMYGMGGTPHHFSLVLMDAGERQDADV